MYYCMCCDRSFENPVYSKVILNKKIRYDNVCKFCKSPLIFKTDIKPIIFD